MKHNSMAISALVALALAGCGGTQSVQGGPCPVLPVGPALVYPAPGATGVPDGNFTMVLTENEPATLNSSSATVGPFPTAAVPSPLPSPYASPLPNAPFGAYGAFTVGALSPATTYTLTITWTTEGCPTTTQTGGSFTTR